MINGFQNFVIINILALTTANLLVIILIYFWTIRASLEKRYDKKTKGEIEIIIEKYIDGLISAKEVKAIFSTKKKKMIAIDILIEAMEKGSDKGSDISKELELDLFLIKMLNKKASLQFMKKLAFIKSEAAYDVFFKCLNESDADIQFLCFYGLSKLKIDMDKKYRVIDELLKSDLLIDRQVELLNGMDIDISQWLAVLDIKTDEMEKSVILKIIHDNEDISKEVNADRVLKYLEDDKEVRIAAILALCKSKNVKYLPELFKLYKKESVWEVRAAIAKGLSNYELSLIKDMLLEMFRDEEWWVRFNAARTISQMGEEGIYILIELSVDKSDENAAALAYYFLNSNKEIYETVKNLEV